MIPRIGTARARGSATRAFTMALALAAQIGLAGCQSSGHATPRNALSMYESGDFEGAYKAATRAHGRPGLAGREEAALVAGMSAYEMGHLSTAEQWLSPLTSSSDREIAGRASATLGLVAVSRGDFAGAAVSLAKAGRLLDGEEAAQANFFAGECYSIVGRTEAARLMYQLSKGGASHDSDRDRVVARLGPDEFAVQLGAFTSKENADRAAQMASPRATRMGLGTPRIVSSNDLPSRMLYLVQVGRFKTEAEADAARVRMGSDAVVVAAAE